MVCLTEVDKLKLLPPRPGVYFFKDAGGVVIYVGKALSLKNRVRSYFQQGGKVDPKVRSMMARAEDFDYIVTDNEVEALILESNLIKEHRPRYNILLKDDKSYPYIKVTMGEEFPRVHTSRRVVKDGARYFGPYTRVGAVNETLALLKRLFPIRSCKDKSLPQRDRPCLNFHINRCLAPCCGMIVPEDYRNMVREVCLFLEGRQEELVKRLADRMAQAAEKMEYEKAAELRDQLRAVEKVLEKQKIVFSGSGDRDVIAMARGVDRACVMVFFIRGGKLLGREKFLLQVADEDSRQEIVTAFVKQYYNGVEFIPGELILSEVQEQELEVVSRWLSGLRGHSVQVKVPQRGDKRKLVEMVEKNALLALEEADQEASYKKKAGDVLSQFLSVLGLEAVPRRMECYDISNTQGTEPVASMVVFEDGRPAPHLYRRFKIKTVEGPDDFASMEEVISRRFNRGLEEKKLINTGQLSLRQARFFPLPDMVLVDGGKGQLSAAAAAMDRSGAGTIPVFGLAKQEEQVFARDEAEPLCLPRDSGALHLLQRIRDEAHRFAVTYHRRLRTSRNLRSLLDDIQGIGPVRRRELQRAFPSLEAMGKATIEELAAVPGMNKNSARAVYEYFNVTHHKSPAEPS